MLRRRILDDARLPYVRVTLDPSWHLPGDLHPDSRGAQAIAIAVAGRLRTVLKFRALMNEKACNDRSTHLFIG
jgi:hypothetical protein